MYFCYFSTGQTCRMAMYMGANKNACVAQTATHQKTADWHCCYTNNHNSNDAKLWYTHCPHAGRLSALAGYLLALGAFLKSISRRVACSLFFWYPYILFNTVVEPYMLRASGRRSLRTCAQQCVTVTCSNTTAICATDKLIYMTERHSPELQSEPLGMSILVCCRWQTQVKVNSWLSLYNRAIMSEILLLCAPVHIHS